MSTKQLIYMLSDPDWWKGPQENLKTILTSIYIFNSIQLLKFFKKLIHTRPIEFINKNGLLFQHQLSSQKGKSSENGITGLYSNILKGTEIY